MSNPTSTKAASAEKKRTITMACGHKLSVHCAETKEESDRIVRRRKDELLCDKCISKHEANWLVEAAIVGCRHARCAELTGTDKQIRWAEAIRFAHLLALDEYRCVFEEILIGENTKRVAASAVIRQTLKWLKSITEAKWWIDNHAESFKATVGFTSSWRGVRETVEIITMAMKILIVSPYMNASGASALDLEDRWNKFVKEKADAEAQAKALAHAIIVDKELEPKLVARARALAWHGVIKPWWQNGENRLYFNEMGNCSICWMPNKFDRTVRFWRMDDSPESRQLAKDIWHWCMNEPNSNNARSLQI